MALSARKKKGIGFLIGGVAFLAAGGVFIGLANTPDWLNLAFMIVGAIGNILGFTVVFPDTSD